MQNGYLQPSDLNTGDDDISDILGLGQNDSQQQRLALQMKLANALRQGSVSQGASVPSGSVFLPNTLQTAMNQFDHIQGIVAQAQGKKDGAQLDKDRQKGLEHFARMWFNKNGQGMAADPNDPNTLTGPPQPSPQPDPNDQDVPQS